MDIDTIKSAAIGSGGLTVQFMDFLPDIIKMGVGIVTIIYFVYKIQLIRRELRK